MNSESSLGLGDLDPTGSIDDLMLSSMDRIHRGDAFVVNAAGIHPSIVWDFAKLQFKDFETEEIQNAFSDLATATMTLVNTPNDQAPEALQKARQKLASTHIDEHFQNPELAKLVLEGHATQSAVLSAFIFELKDYTTHGEVFQKLNGQLDLDAQEDFENRVLPSIATLVTEQSLTDD